MSTELDEISIPTFETPAGGDLEIETVAIADPESETPDVDEDEPDQVRPSDDELDEDDQADELDEDEPGVNRPGPSSEKEIEQGFKKLESEATRHAKRVAEIMGEAVTELVPCELCAPAIPGFRFDVEIRGPQLEAVKAAIGIETSPELRADTYSRVCDGCDGWGRVLSGSHVGREATLVCRGCKSRGWIPIGPEREAELAASPEVVDVGEPNSAGESLPELDAWNTPIGHPEYGVSPQYRRLPLPTFEG